MASVLICIQMLRQLYDIPEDSLECHVAIKQEEIMRRIEKEVQFDTNTNAERIRHMTDEELAEWLTNMGDFEKNEEPYKSVYNLNAEKEEIIHDSYEDLLEWLQSESE